MNSVEPNCILLLGWDYRAGKAAFRFQRSGCMFGRIFSVFYGFKYIIPNWSGYNEVRNSSMDIHGIIDVSTRIKLMCISCPNTIFPNHFAQKIVLDQYKTFDPTHERHFLDLYFKQIHDGKEDFSRKPLIIINAVFFLILMTIYSQLNR